MKLKAVLTYCACAYLLLNLVSCKPKTLFIALSSDKTGITFQNNIMENDSINPLNVENMYNGGGVGIADFNNDGLQDIYFTGNMVPNKLYLNKGNLKFEDITDKASVNGGGKWCRGIAIVDINNDGKMDMYVSCTLKSQPLQRANLLYINEGNDKNNVPHFKEMAEEYGLADTGQSTQAAFFDYDNDGDLDVYIATNEIANTKLTYQFRPILKNGENPSTGRLYRNDWNESLKHAFFTNVSKEAGIQTEGYAHAVTVADFNNDGWKDLYVTNDFITNDLLWINNHDGTFTNQLSAYFKHTSTNAMGNDVTDINNDGLMDVVTLDMNPQDNWRKKMMMNANNYDDYINTNFYGYSYQYVRNTLQLNCGNSLKANDSIGNPVFSEIAFHAGISETDWSWCPLVTDFDNDSYKDIIVTNGYPKDVTDHDFIAYRNEVSAIANKQTLLAQIPQVKLHNYAYKNNGDLTFADETKDWGFETPTFSNGAAYADLDNDGDLDVIINNINDEAGVYENTASDNKHHYLRVKLKGAAPNINALGSYVTIYYNGNKKQVWENSPYRGYLSSVEDVAHFGLDTTSVVDSLVVMWLLNKKQKLLNVKADQLLVLDVKNANETYSIQTPVVANAIFSNTTSKSGINYTQQDKDYIDFNIQKLLPHKFSEYGPGLCAGDINGDGLDDIISGGSRFHASQIFLQRADGKFTQQGLYNVKDSLAKKSEDTGLLLFDADGDSDNDLYIASGGFEADSGDVSYEDKLYINDGKGNFLPDSLALPKNYTSKFCVRACDYDKDGDLDLFVAGRVSPWHYPLPVSSCILRNDTKNGVVKFTDVTTTAAKDLIKAGLVCDAVFTDFDNDGWTDLILAGEWMPVTLLKNNKGGFKNITLSTGLENQIGWWNSIAPGDFDNDGDIDYIVGNLGLNSYYKASDKQPVRVYADDFNKDGYYDAITSTYLPEKENGEMKEFPVALRDDIIKQVIQMRARYVNYKNYAVATMDSVLMPEQRKNALILKANQFASCYLRNDGNEKFTCTSLPVQAQLSVLNGMNVADFDGDGNLDIVINGNDYGTEVSSGRYDALNGLFLKGDGNGNFSPLSIMQSGIYIPGNGKALVALKSADNKYILTAGQNRGPLLAFNLNNTSSMLLVQPNDAFAQVHLKNGKTRKEEFYYGSSFLSQSSRFLLRNNNVVSIDITDTNNKKRSLH